MNMPDDHDDQHFDELLRDLGPDVPRPALDEPVRARLLASMDDPDVRTIAGRTGRPGRWRSRLTSPVAAGLLVAAALGVSCIVLGSRLARTEGELATAQWQADEVLQLLVRARRTQPLIAAPDDVAGLSRSDLALITFHHDLCPIARVCTPGFAKLALQHRGDTVRFLTFDVTGSKRESVDHQIDALDLRFALLGPLGAETGVVKVLDTRHHRVLCSAPGALGLTQAERLLARIGEDGRP
ncbi:MAG: hypothetical protein KDA25_02140 [Phycisphaerales bacterium]|nr:hypothetical protein [Phycisphaerales bacterium]